MQRIKPRRKVDLVPYLFIGPQLILFAIFFIIPAATPFVTLFSAFLRKGSLFC